MQDFLAFIGIVVLITIAAALITGIIYSVVHHDENDKKMKEHETRLERLQRQLDGLAPSARRGRK